MPLTLEDKLLDALGDVARVEPDGIHCRWGERNAEFCHRLEAAAEARRRELGNERWRTTIAPLADAEQTIADVILGVRNDDLAWCLDCHALTPSGGHAGHDTPLLLRAGESQTLAAFRDYLATDPLDRRLLEREGEPAVLERLRHGDFGDAYRESWQSHARRRATLVLRTDVRSTVRTLRSAKRSTDMHFTATNVVLSIRPLA